MRLSSRLKSWLVSNMDMAADSSDEEFRQTTATSLADESLSVEKYTQLTETEEDATAGDFVNALKDFKDTLNDFKSVLTSDDMDEDDEVEEEKAASLAGEEIDPSPKITAPKKKNPPKMEDDDEDMEYDDEDEEESAPPKPPKKDDKEKKMSVPGGTKGGDRSRPSALEKMIVKARGGVSYDEDELGEKSFDIRVKEAADNYSDTKSTLTYPMTNEAGHPHSLAGRPVKDFNTTEMGGSKNLDTASELDQAVAGSWGKFMVAKATLKSRNLAMNSLPQHDRELIYYAMENMKWGGASDGGDLADIKGRKLTSLEQKALIDDSTSGGLEAAPIVFDDQVIQTPLLNGELYPSVNTIPLDRGRRVEGVATGTVTGSWGGVDDTAISLFSTASYVSAFDTTIFRWEGSIRIGLDFLSDSPIDFGAHITAQYGERLLEDLDDVIATGNGTTQPEGVINKTGVTSVAFGAATSIGSYESLRFGVAKPEHRASLKSTAVFCGTETSYQRARAIPVGASDARRLGGTTNVLGGVSGYDSYTWMDRPYKINESLTNAQIFYAILGRYRCYRRRGLTMRTSTEGDTLIRRNEMLMVAMGRFGGQLERGATAAITTTAEA